MRHYEVTFIIDPVLSDDEIKQTAQTYIDSLKEIGCDIVHIDEMGLRQLAYPIRKRTTGVYYCVEFSNANGSFINRFELALRRDERIVRFLTVSLDKYGIKYNQDKRDGKIGQWKKELEAQQAKEEADAKKAEEAKAAAAKAKAEEAKAEEPKTEAPAEEAKPAEEPVATTETVENNKDEN